MEAESNLVWGLSNTVFHIMKQQTGFNNLFKIFTKNSSILILGKSTCLYKNKCSAISALF